MSTIEEKVIYLGVKIGEIAARLDTLDRLMKQYVKVEVSREAAFADLAEQLRDVEVNQQAFGILLSPLREQVAELERGLDATNRRTSKQHYALEKRFAEFKRLAGFRDKLIEKNYGMIEALASRMDQHQPDTASLYAERLVARKNKAQRPARERDDADGVDVTEAHT